MIKRSTKVTSLLVTAASMVSMVPAVAADLKKADTNEGTIYTAKSMGFGNYILSGEINGEDDAVYYLENGKYTELEDASTGDEIGDIYKDKYLDFNNGDYYIDITTGKEVEDEDFISDLNDDVASALRKNIKHDNDGRFDESTYNGGTVIEPDQIKGNKKTDIWGATGKWRQFTYDLTTKYQFEGKMKSTIYTDEKGNYVDADYNLGKIGVYLTTDAGVKIENTEDAYEVKEGNDTYELKAQIQNAGTKDEDNDYITRTANLTIWKKLKTDPDTAYTNVTDEVYFGSKSNRHRAATLNSDNSVTVMQRISKEQASDDIDGIKYAKTVKTYFITDEDGNQAHVFGLGDVSELGTTIAWGGGDVALVTGSSDGIASHFYDASEKKYYAQNINFKSDNGYYYTDIGDYDDVDADAWGIGGGNLYCLGDGYVQKWMNKDDKFEKIYKVDGGLENFSVSFDSSVAAWNTDDEIYSLLFNKPSSEEGKDKTTTTDAITTTTKTGWGQAADGTWSFIKADGTKATGWLQDGVVWYYLNTNGVMATGWQNVGGTWYYLNASGAMQTGWINDNGTWYYCNESGAMLYSTTVNGYVLGANGSWVK